MELVERIGVNLFIQVIIEMWNGIFLLIMIFSLIISIRDNRKNKHIDIVIPFTTDILVFYITLYILTKYIIRKIDLQPFFNMIQ